MLLPWFGCPTWVLAASVVPLKETRYNTLPPPLKNILPPSPPALGSCHCRCTRGCVRSYNKECVGNFLERNGCVVGSVFLFEWRQTGGAWRGAVAEACCVFLADILECTKGPCFLCFSYVVDRYPLKRYQIQCLQERRVFPRRKLTKIVTMAVEFSNSIV